MKKLNLIFILLFAISALGFSQNDSVTISLNDTIKLELVREVFQKKTHSVKYLNDTDLLIDNQIQKMIGKGVNERDIREYLKQKNNKRNFYVKSNNRTKRWK